MKQGQLSCVNYLRRRPIEGRESPNFYCESEQFFDFSYYNSSYAGWWWNLQSRKNSYYDDDDDDEI